MKYVIDMTNGEEYTNTLNKILMSSPYQHVDIEGEVLYEEYDKFVEYIETICAADDTKIIVYCNDIPPLAVNNHILTYLRTLPEFYICISRNI